MWSSERVNELTFQLNDSTPHQTLSGSQQPADQMHQRHFSLELQLQRDHLRPQLHLERWQEVVVVLEVHKLCALKQRKHKENRLHVYCDEKNDLVIISPVLVTMFHPPSCFHFIFLCSDVKLSAGICSDADDTLMFVPVKPDICPS